MAKQKVKYLVEFRKVVGEPWVEQGPPSTRN